MNGNRKKVRFVSWSAPFFAEYLAKISGGKTGTMNKLCGPKDGSGGNIGYKENIFLVGLYHPDNQRWFHIRCPKAIVLFAGLDIEQLKKMPLSLRNPLFNYLLSKNIIFMSECPFVQSNIYDFFGLKTGVIYLPSPHAFSKKIVELPATPNVSCYISRENPFHDMLLEVIKNMPDTMFHLYSLDGYNEITGLDNVISYRNPIDNMIEFISHMSCGVRLQPHDTYSMTGIEHLMMGRGFINNHDMPYATFIGEKPTSIDIIKALRKNLEMKEPNRKSINFYTKRHNIKSFVSSLRKVYAK